MKNLKHIKSQWRYRGRVIQLPHALLVAVALIVVLAAATVPVLGQTGGVYDLTWNLAGGSGGALSGGAYTLEGSAGQADAGTMSGGSYALNGGFWVSGGLLSKRLYLPLTLKGGN
jgi:hypothetical protein